MPPAYNKTTGGIKVAKKEQPKKLVQMTMTKDDIVTYGYNQALKRSWKKAMIRFLIMLGVVMVTTWFSIMWLAMVFAIGMFCYLLVWMMRCQKAGKRLFESVKDKPEPVGL